MGIERIKTNDIMDDLLDVEILTPNGLKDPLKRFAYCVFRVKYKKWDEIVPAEVEIKYMSHKVKSVELKKISHAKSYEKYSTKLEYMNFPIKCQYVSIPIPEGMSPFYDSPLLDKMATAKLPNLRGNRPMHFLVRFEFFNNIAFKFEWELRVGITVKNLEYVGETIKK